MHLAILSSPNSWYRRDLERAATVRGHRVTSLPFEQLSAELRTGHATVDGHAANLASVDAVIVRTMPPGSLEQVVFRMNLLAQLETRGVQADLPTGHRVCGRQVSHDARLTAAGLPVPETIVCETAESAQVAFEKLGGRRGQTDLRLRGTRHSAVSATPIWRCGRFARSSGCRPCLIRMLHRPRRLRRAGDGPRRSRAGRGCCRNAYVFAQTFPGRRRPQPFSGFPIENSSGARRREGRRGTPGGSPHCWYHRAGNGYVIEVNGVPGWQAVVA